MKFNTNYWIWNRLMAYWVECSPMVLETRVQSQVVSYQKLFKKWYVISPCLRLGIIRYVSRIKWSNPGKGVTPSPTPQCSSYWKGSLQVALSCSHHLYFYLCALKWTELIEIKSLVRRIISPFKACRILEDLWINSVCLITLSIIKLMHLFQKWKILFIIS